MSFSRIVRNSLTMAFTLSVAGVAFARQPPALVAAQRADAQAADWAPRTAGYRDMYARAPGASDLNEPRTVFAGAGYRDMYARSRVTGADGTTTNMGRCVPRVSTGGVVSC